MPALYTHGTIGPVLVLPDPGSAHYTVALQDMSVWERDVQIAQ